MTRTWRIGTRGSALALVQSQHVAQLLREASGDDVELIVIRTKGDAVVDRPLAEVGGKGLFTKEIEDAMLAGEVDLAVHSMKDMPTEGPPGLVIAGIPEREDPRDALVGARLEDLPRGARVGTGSARRRMQLLAARPDLVVDGIRGNVGTRIGKQRDGSFAAVVLAAAGLARLDLSGNAAAYLDVDLCVPAVGQGALAIQCRAADAELVSLLEGLSDEDAVAEVALERAFLIELGGGCSAPVACHAMVDGDRLRVHAFVGRDDGAWVSEAGVCERTEADGAGRALAQRLVERLARQPERDATEGVAPRPR